jgi:hypothetical protein
MSLDTPLSDIQETVERTIFHSIRKHCVAKGYTPDITGYEKTPEAYKEYLAALQQINAVKGFSIEVFSAGAPADRVSKQLPRIVVSNQGFIPGSVGGDESHQYKLNQGAYHAYIAPPTTSDYYFNVHIASNSIKQHRILNSILALAVPRRGYMPAHEEDFNLFVRHMSYLQLRDHQNAPGTIETISRFVCPDLFEVEDIIIKENISPLKEVNLNIGDSSDNYIIS